VAKGCGTRRKHCGPKGRRDYEHMRVMGNRWRPSGVRGQGRPSQEGHVRKGM